MNVMAAQTDAAVAFAEHILVMAGTMPPAFDRSVGRYRFP